MNVFDNYCSRSCSANRFLLLLYDETSTMFCRMAWLYLSFCDCLFNSPFRLPCMFSSLPCSPTGYTPRVTYASSCSRDLNIGILSLASVFSLYDGVQDIKEMSLLVPFNQKVTFAASTMLLEQSSHVQDVSAPP